MADPTEIQNGYKPKEGGVQDEEVVTAESPTVVRIREIIEKHGPDREEYIEKRDRADTKLKTAEARCDKKVRAARDELALARDEHQVAMDKLSAEFPSLGSEEIVEILKNLGNRVYSACERLIPLFPSVSRYIDGNRVDSVHFNFQIPGSGQDADRISVRLRPGKIKDGQIDWQERGIFNFLVMNSNNYSVSIALDKNPYHRDDLELSYMDDLIRPLENVERFVSGLTEDQCKLLSEAELFCDLAREIAELGVKPSDTCYSTLIGTGEGQLKFYPLPLKDN